VLGKIDHKSIIDQTITAIHAEQLNLNAKPAVGKIDPGQSNQEPSLIRHESEKPHS
jgi:hypothetical protein